jgi:hypothetical protein
MKKILAGLLFGFVLSLGMRTTHSIFCNYYFRQCNAEHLEGSGPYNPVICMNQKMGYLNLLSAVSGFPMYFFDKWEWYG